MERKFKIILSIFLVFSLLISYQTATEAQSDLIQDELDEIYSLLAYSVVLKDWQTGGENQRGHNIGSVLVNPEGKVVFWARNCNHITGNGTQHGEVRLMLGYLDIIRSYNLEGYTVYTTLEPCVQCSGMMILTNIKRTVYGQTDPGFGKALERLALDSTKLPNGYEPYPREVISDCSQCIICKKLDNAYEETKGSLTGFLLSETAKEIFTEANKMLLNYKVKYEINEKFYKEAKEFLEKEVSDSFKPLKPKI